MEKNRLWRCFWCIVTNLSKAYDCILHDFVTAKLEAYGFQIKGLKIVHDYFLNRKQKVKTDEAFSSWKHLEYGVPQGPIPGPLLFNIHLCDFLLP